MKNEKWKMSYGNMKWKKYNEEWKMKNGKYEMSIEKNKHIYNM